MGRGGEENGGFTDGEAGGGRVCAGGRNHEDVRGVVGGEGFDSCSGIRTHPNIKESKGKREVRSKSASGLLGQELNGKALCAR
jgi:hypothetical protein